MKEIKVLQFEDANFLAEMYEVSFKKDGFRYSHYSNPPEDPEQLVELVLKEKPDLISMGIIMPEMDGFGATRILKNDPRTKDVPIFGFDNLSQKEAFEEAMEAGMDDYFVMAHMMPNDYAGIIRKFLNKKGNGNKKA